MIHDTTQITYRYNTFNSNPFCSICSIQIQKYPYSNLCYLYTMTTHKSITMNTACLQLFRAQSSDQEVSGLFSLHRDIYFFTISHCAKDLMISSCSPSHSTDINDRTETCPSVHLHTLMLVYWDTLAVHIKSVDNCIVKNYAINSCQKLNMALLLLSLLYFLAQQ